MRRTSFTTPGPKAGVWALLFFIAACPAIGPQADADPPQADAAPAPPDAASPDAASPDDLDDGAAMVALVRQYADLGWFMGATLVTRRGVILTDRAYGFANAEWDVPSTPTTKFRIGSMSKQFTAVALLLLEEEGELSVDDPLSKYLPDIPAAWAPITLHHLLTHSSGIPDIVLFPEFPSLRPLPTTLELTYARLKDKPLDFAPGAKFQYSNSGYIVLALVIQRLTGQPYEAVLQDRVLDRVGLHDTGSDANRTLLKGRASGYVALTPIPQTPAGTPAPLPTTPAAIRNADFVDMSVPTGAGALYTTTGDLLRWERALFGGALLTPASLAKMTTPHAGNYGYGLFIGQYDGLSQISHGGSINGFLSSMSYFPELDVVVVVLSNLTTGPYVGAISSGLADIAIHKGRRSGDAADGGSRD
jgi:CubicO group peptidase (beta-lactamase class C family)